MISTKIYTRYISSILRCKILSCYICLYGEKGHAWTNKIDKIQNAECTKCVVALVWHNTSTSIRICVCIIALDRKQVCMFCYGRWPFSLFAELALQIMNSQIIPTTIHLFFFLYSSTEKTFSFILAVTMEEQLISSQWYFSVDTVSAMRCHW